jgi:hypothetical protein
MPRRYRTYFRRILETGEVNECEFSEDHFREAGVPVTPNFGMPLLEAHELVNKWNRCQITSRFMFWLE